MQSRKEFKIRRTRPRVSWLPFSRSDSLKLPEIYSKRSAIVRNILTDVSRFPFRDEPSISRVQRRGSPVVKLDSGGRKRNACPGVRNDTSHVNEARDERGRRITIYLIPVRSTSSIVVFVGRINQRRGPGRIRPGERPRVP